MCEVEHKPCVRPGEVVMGMTSGRKKSRAQAGCAMRVGDARRSSPWTSRSTGFVVLFPADLAAATMTAKVARMHRWKRTPQAEYAVRRGARARATEHAAG